jgi:hypothetical protein
MGNLANLLGGPAKVYYDNSGLVDVGYTKEGVKADITPKVFTFETDQTGKMPATKVLSGVEAYVLFNLAEYSLDNLKLALANAVPLQDDTTPTKKRLEIRPQPGKNLATSKGKKWVFKPIDPATGIETTNKDLWITVPIGAPDETTVSITWAVETQLIIPIRLYCFPDSANKDRVLFWGDETAVDANESGF